MTEKSREIEPHNAKGYKHLVTDIGELLEVARHTTTRSVNAIMTATYWEIGRRIVEFEQEGAERAQYGEGLLKSLSTELSERFGRGFSQDNLERFRLFYLRVSPELISATPLRKSSDGLLKAAATEKSATVLRISNARGGLLDVARMAEVFPLPWSHYVLLIRLCSDEAVRFYHAEALRGGWSVRQLKRQIDSQFYERTALSKNKAAMLQAGRETMPGDIVTAEEKIKDPLVLEFLGLRDEYSESDLEQALILHLETFLLELGGDFAFVARQRRLRIDDEWYRVDLVFFHRRLRCLVLIDLKLGKFSHADAGQMNVYLNYAREHWTHDDENPPIGIILCAAKGESLAHYATAGLENKMLVSKYLTALPNEKVLAAEIDKTRRELEKRGIVS
jgi:predicted nuclease of restriction endonuclease-like (RecB) superfamily